MKLDQIAYYAINDAAVARACEQFGISRSRGKWVEDTVEARSIVFPQSGGRIIGSNRAELLFNYDLGIELEFLRYTHGAHFHMDTAPFKSGFTLFQSHFGFHLEEGDDLFMKSPPGSLIQSSRTISHTSDYLTNKQSPGYGRTYEYAIFAGVGGLPFKYIRRIDPQ